MSKPESTQAARFLGELFAEIPSGHRLLIWELETKKSFWFADTRTAARFADGKSDIYVGCALSPREHGPARRCPEKEVSGIGGVWIDLDYGSAGHKNKNLPPTIEDATSLLSKLIPPTAVVRTGYGVHGWWLFKEMWLFENHDERTKAASLVDRWQQTIRMLAKECGWEVDSTHDLARIMRIPGTFNAKNDPRLVVSIDDAATDWTRRYNQDDLERFIPENIEANAKIAVQQQINRNGERCTIVGFPDVTIRPDRGPSPQKWKVLQAADDRVSATWNRKRRDLNDTSASGHDLSLASFAVQANWADQEICDLLVACSIHHGTEIKTAQYYARTIGHAREFRKQAHAQQEIHDLVTFGSTEGVNKEDPIAVRKKALDSLSKRFGIQIDRIVKYTTDPPNYRLETNCGSINLGEVENLIEQTRFRRKVAAAADKIIPPQSKIEWGITSQLLLDACEHMDAGDDATETGLMKTWFIQYLSEKRVSDQAEDAVMHRRPFYKDGMVHIFSVDFASWLVLSFRERVQQKQLGVMLRNFGAEPKNVRVGNRVVSVWKFKPFGEFVIQETLI